MMRDVSYLVRLVISTAMLFLMGACTADLRQIEGHYQYGHEVNTVCTGMPQKCYWLVDSTPEIRQELKQRVGQEPPYTPVCLLLIAALSDDKATGFGADYDGSIRVQQVVGPCRDSTASGPVLLKDLKHRRWVLVGVDGLSLGEYAVTLGFTSDTLPRKIPELDFGEQGYVSGNNGCNQIRGQARVEESMLVLSNLGATRMACPGFAGELEALLTLTYSGRLAVLLDGDIMSLESGKTRLRFRRQDWE